MTEICAVNINLKGKGYKIDLTLNKGWGFKDKTDAELWFDRFFKKFFEENASISPMDLLKANEKGVFLRDKRVIAHPDLFLLQSNPAVSTAKKAAIVWSTLPVISKKLSQLAPDPNIKTPEASHTASEIATADFEFLNPENHPHVLDKIVNKTRWSAETAALCTKKDLARLEAAYLISENGASKPDSPSVEATHLGTLLGTDERKNYRMKASLFDTMAGFFKKNTIISDDILAKNSPLNGCKTKDGVIQGAISSSFNRHADTITMLRKIESEDGRSDCYAGRVDTLPKAKEMAEFIFLGEIGRFEDFSGLSKGIQLRKDGIYELTFAVQSLLNFFGAEKKMFERQLEAYRKLEIESRENPLTIIHPETKKKYRVVVNPLSISVNLFNWANYLPCIPGKGKAQECSERADEELRKFAEMKIEELRQSRDQEKINQIQDTLNSLLNRTMKKPWEQILARAYLIALLDLPEVIHCKSSVDRTGGVAIPMVFAMKEWLRAGHGVPLVNGRYSISAIANRCIRDKNGKNIYPFKELFALKMLHELKMSEFSRGVKGFKINEGNILHPALRDLLPARYLSLSFLAHFLDKLDSSAAEKLLHKKKIP